MAGEIEIVLNDLKSKGIASTLMRVDGVLVHSTLAMNDLNSGLLSSLVNTSDALLRRFDDSQKEMEVAYQSSILFAIPLKNHIFCGLLNNREEKPTVRLYADKLKEYLQ
ncbi:MAG: hypothetical protein ACP5N9_00090 [Candidatus Bilamarchaeum sp.]|jgi:hypothetical protein